MRSGSVAESKTNERGSSLLVMAGLALIALLAILVLTAPGAQAATLTASGTQPIDVPSNLATTTASNHVVTVVLATATSSGGWPVDGNLVVQFPPTWTATPGSVTGFALTGTACSAPGAGGILAPTLSAGQVVLTRDGTGGICGAGAIVSFSINALTNPTTSGAQSIDVRTRNAGLATIDSVSTSITITGAPAPGAITTTPASPVAGGTTSYAFTYTGAGTWPANGLMQIQFPASYPTQPYAVTGVTGPSGGSCVTGTLSAVGANVAQTPAGPAAASIPTVTLTRIPGGACTSGQIIGITIAGVKNPGISGTPAGSITVSTFVSGGSQRTFVDGVVVDTAPAGPGPEDTTLTSAAGAAFAAADIGRLVIGTGIPSGTTITAVASATSATLSTAGVPGALATTTVVKGLVDRVNSVPPTMVVGTMTGATITATPSTAIAGVLASWKFAWTSPNALPAGGDIRITFPADVDLSGVTTPATLTGCTSGVFPVTRVGQLVTIARATSGTNVAADCPAAAFSVTLGGIRNPRYAGVQTFGVAGDLRTTNGGGLNIDFGTSSITINPGALTATAGWVSDTTAGATPTTYRLEFTPANVWKVADELWLTLPTTVDLSGATWNPTTGCLAAITPTVTLVSPGVYKLTRTGGSDCVGGVPVTVEILGAKNPTVSGTIAVPLRTRTSAPADIDTGSVSITITPAIMTDGVLAVASTPSAAGAPTAISISFTPKNTWPFNGKAVFTFPTEVDFKGDQVEAIRVRLCLPRLPFHPPASASRSPWRNSRP